MKIFLLVLMFVTTGCTNYDTVVEVLDQKSFETIGTTLFSEPSEISLSEIHLGSGVPKSREIVVEGELLEVGEYATYVVIGDANSRMLVVLTHLNTPQVFSESSTGRIKLRVLGVVKGGQRGLPYVQARSLNLGTFDKAS